MVWDFNKGLLDITRVEPNLYYSLKRDRPEFQCLEYSGTVTCKVKGKELSCQVLARLNCRLEGSLPEELKGTAKALYDNIQFCRDPIRLSEFHNSLEDYQMDHGRL
eukprot:TRINITY_DN724_c0_g1_i9.p1 TRINITY_DN724_c0_g1~~TRINITY_DN724_c0_g1_i9.p1  ORF type:complete len:106 (-),score=6.13 TRINITY_DN724_c0_g1_i9:125-442(-)